MTKITEMTESGTLGGTELLEVSQLSSTVTMTEITLSALASDNSFNDSASGFVTAGFVVGDTVSVSGFTTGANNLTTGVITALTADKMTIGGTDGDVIVDEVEGDSVTISKWTTVRSTSQDIADLSSASVTYLDRVLMDSAVIDATLTTPPGSPTDGDAYIVPASATGDWASQDDKIAIYETSAWVFYAPAEGYFLRDQTNDTTYQYDGSAWTEFTSGGGGSGDTYQQNLGMVLIGTYDLSAIGQTLDSGNEIDVDVSGYSAAFVGIRGGAVAVADSIRMRFSADGGSTFRSTSGDYVQSYFTLDTDGSGVNVTDILVAGEGTGTTAINGDMALKGLDDAATTVHVSGLAASSGKTYQLHYYSTNLEAVDTLRFFTSGGNAMTAGTLTIWGIPKQRANEALGLVERTYPATLTISAAASGTWAIPANCTKIHLHSSVMAASTTSGVLNFRLHEASGGADASFDGVRNYSLRNGGDGANSYTAVTYFAQLTADATSNSDFGFDVDILMPRDASVKTRCNTEISSTGSASGSASRAHYVGVGDAAEDHDIFELEISAGTLTGTVHITYTVLEAEPGYQKLEFTTATAMTISQVPALVESDLAANGTHTLPANAPTGTIVEFTEMDATYSTTIQAPTGETMNGVSNGSCTLNAQYASASFRKLSTGWLAKGDHGGVS